MIPLNAKTLLGFLALASAGLLIGAYLFEYVGGLAPCPLCLWQRVPHALLLAVVFSSLFMPLGSRSIFLLCALIYGASAALAAAHIGVEQGLWMSPVACGGGASGIAWEMGAFQEALGESAALSDCAVVPWSLFGISLAGYNFLASAGLFAVAFWAWARRFR